jgi:hypothetical protein
MNFKIIVKNLAYLIHLHTIQQNMEKINVNHLIKDIM